VSVCRKKTWLSTSRAPDLLGFRDARTLPLKIMLPQGRKSGQHGGIFPKNEEAELAVGIDLAPVVALRRCWRHGGAVGVDLASVLQAVGIDRPVVVALRGCWSHGGAVGVDPPTVLPVRGWSDELEEEVPETAGENPPSWRRGGGVDRSSGGGRRGEEEAQGKDGGDHEPYQGFSAHVRTLIPGRSPAGPPAARPACPPDRIVSQGMPYRRRFSHSALRLMPRRSAARPWWPRV